MKKLLLLLLFTAIAFWLFYEKEYFILGFVIVVLIPIIRAVNNIRNGKKWYDSMDNSGE